MRPRAMLKAMKITLLCKPGAKTEKMEKLEESVYRVWVKAPPEEGAAHRAVRELVAAYFKVAVSQVEILAGQKSKRKVAAVKI